MSAMRWVVLSVTLLAIVMLVLVSNGSGLSARSGADQRAEHARVARLAAVGVVERLRNIGPTARLGMQTVEIDADTGRQLAPSEVAQRLSNARS